MTSAGFGGARTAINVFAIWTNRILAILVVLVTIPIITRHFGLELMGVWLLVTQFTQHLMLLELGLNTSLTRFISRYRGKNDLVGASRYLSSSIFVLTGIGGILIVLSPLLALGFLAAFQLPSELEDQVYWLVLLATLATGISLPLRTGIGMLSSVHRFDRISIWESLVLVVRLGLVLICFNWFNPDLLLLGLISFIPILLGNMLIFNDGWKANIDLTVSRRLITKKVLRHMLSVCGASVVITLSVVVVRQSSPMLVGWGIGIDQVATLAFPILIVSTVMPFMGVANTLIAPIASQLDAGKNRELLYRLYTMAGRYVFSMALLVLMGFYYLGHSLLDLWLSGPKVDGDTLHDMSKALVVIFAGFVIATPGFIVREVLMAVGRHWQAASSEVLGSLMGVIVGYWLMMGMNLGVMGMAMGISLAFIVRGAGFLAMRGAKYFAISYLKLLSDSMGRPIVISGLAMLVSQLSVIWVPQSFGTGLSELISFIIVCLIWASGVWLWIVESEHKKKISTWLARF